MTPELAPIWNFLVDQQPDLLIKALMLAVGLSIAATLAFQGISRLRAWDPTATLAALVLAANAASMLAGAGFAVAKLSGQAPAPGPSSHHDFRPLRRVHASPSIGPAANQIFTLADSDRDGLLSAEEAGRAARAFIRTHGDDSPGGEGGLDAAQLQEAMRQQFRPQDPRKPRTDRDNGKSGPAPERPGEVPVARPSEDAGDRRPVG